MQRSHMKARHALPVTLATPRPGAAGLVRLCMNTRICVSLCATCERCHFVSLPSVARTTTAAGVVLELYSVTRRYGSYRAQNCPCPRCEWLVAYVIGMVAPGTPPRATPGPHASSRLPAPGPHARPWGGSRRRGRSPPRASPPPPGDGSRGQC